MAESEYLKRCIKLHKEIQKCINEIERISNENVNTIRRLNDDQEKRCKRNEQTRG